jgi:hypothetical protein
MIQKHCKNSHRGLVLECHEKKHSEISTFYMYSFDEYQYSIGC